MNQDRSALLQNGQSGSNKNFVRKSSSIFLIYLLFCCIMQNMKRMMIKADQEN